MSIRDLAKFICSLTPAQRRELDEMLSEMEGTKVAEETPHPAMAFNEAINYVFANFDTALRKLAQ